MASFDSFFPILIRDEGYWANIAGDRGGRTWEGISEVDNPGWAGWAIINGHTELDFTDNSQVNIEKINLTLRSDPRLQPLVISFYKAAYWNKMNGDDIDSQSVANFICDWGVNAGFKPPIRHAQQILNITADGEVGPDTINSINAADAQTLFNNLKLARIAFYKAVVANNPSDEKFLSEWIKRTNSFIFQS